MNRNDMAKIRRRNMKKAQSVKKFKQSQKPRKKYPQKAPKNPPVSKRKFKRALKGTAGVYKEIAQRLNTSVHQVKKYLDRPGWEDMREAWREEKDRVMDLAEDAVARAIECEDLELATKNARWYLERKGKDKGYSDRLEIEGGDRPVRHEHGVVVLDARKLAELSVEERKEMLKRINEEEMKQLPEGQEQDTIDAEYSKKQEVQRSST